MCKMTKAELEEENRNLKMRLERIASITSMDAVDFIFDEQIAEGHDFDRSLSVAYGRTCSLANFYASPDENGVYFKLYL